MLTGFYTKEKWLLFQMKFSTNHVENKLHQIKVVSSMTKTDFNSKHKQLPFKAKVDFTQSEKRRGLSVKEKLAPIQNKNGPPLYGKKMFTHREGEV